MGDGVVELVCVSLEECGSESETMKGSGQYSGAAMTLSNLSMKKPSIAATFDIFRRRMEILFVVVPERLERPNSPKGC